MRAPLFRSMKKAQLLNIILLGDPAAGKATQAAFLIKKYPLFDLDMGKELRKLQATDQKVKKLLEKTYDRGHTTQTVLVRKIFKEKIFSAPKHKSILFDGNPKQIGEAKLIYGWLKKQGRQRSILIYLSIPMSETIKRMGNRVEYFKGKFSKRTDDNKIALENRVKYYRKNVAGVIKFFKSKYPYKKISGLGNKEEVKKRIELFIEKEYAKTRIY
jgi:adenylate kinase